MSLKPLLLLLALALPFSVAAQDVSEVVNTLQDEEDTAIVVADDPSDRVAANMLQDEFGVTTTTTPDEEPEGSYIIVGGPCANPRWTAVAGDTCEGWQYGEGQAVIIADRSIFGSTVLMVAGTTAIDTRRAVDWLVANPNSAMLNEDRVVLDVTQAMTGNQTGTFPGTGATVGTGDNMTDDRFVDVTDDFVDRPDRDENATGEFPSDLYNPADNTLTIDGFDDEDEEDEEDDDEEDDE